MRTKGRLSAWNDTKGFGFITPVSGGSRVFIHISAFTNGNRRPAIDNIVTYTLSSDKKGRPCATKAALSGDQLPDSTKRRNSLFTFLVAAFFLAIVGISVAVGSMPILLFMLYIATSIVSFIAYALDKSASRKGAWRTQESTLHLLALAGGWPGALVAQQVLRHKTRKQSFRVVYWATVLINCGVFVWLFTPGGVEFLQSVL